MKVTFGDVTIEFQPGEQAAAAELVSMLRLTMPEVTVWGAVPSCP